MRPLIPGDRRSVDRGGPSRQHGATPGSLVCDDYSCRCVTPMSGKRPHGIMKERAIAESLRLGMIRARIPETFRMCESICQRKPWGHTDLRSAA
jgi:hypothetical protein